MFFFPKILSSPGEIVHVIKSELKVHYVGIFQSNGKLHLFNSPRKLIFFVRFEKKTILFIALLCGGLKMKITNYLIIIVAKANMCK